MVRTQPRRHAKMVNVRMRDDSMANIRGFCWITWRGGGSKTIVQQQTGSIRIFQHNADVAYLIATAKVMKPQTR